jgi:hypothetical protein
MAKCVQPLPPETLAELPPYGARVTPPQYLYAGIPYKPIVYTLHKANNKSTNRAT